MNAAFLAQLFDECASSDPVRLKAAEQHLVDAPKHPEFLSCLLQVIESNSLPTAVRQLAAICFKNHIKRHWDAPEGILSEDRTLVKGRVLDLIIGTSTERQIQTQLSSAIEMIAVVDFPSDWSSLLPDLVKNHLLSTTTGLQTKCAALEIADVVLERYRRADHCNDVLGELKFILLHIEQPLLDIFRESLSRVLALGPNAKVTPELEQCFNLLRHCVRIFYSLVSVDLPEFIEDNKGDFFRGFLQILEYQNVHFSGRNIDVNTEGPLEEMKAEVCRVLTHFAQRYCEEFEDIVDPCVAAVLNLLQTSTSSEPYMDGLVSSAMKFLGASARFRWTPSPFTRDRLTAICQHVVVPNIRLRQSDIELVEDNPHEFIRRALEGGETDTRRGTAVELVHALSHLYEAEISDILPSYINSLLEASDRATTAEDKQTFKDAAVYLVIAVVVKAESRQFGVSQTNPSVDIQSFFVSRLLDELRVPADGKISNILVRSASLKFVATFRNQLDKKILLQLFPEIVCNIGLQDPIVHTHASYCLENLLLARQLATENTPPSAARGVLKFQKYELKESLLFALETLFKAATSQTGIRENEYPMRCIMKVLGFLQEESRDCITLCLEALRDILKIQCDTSNNPVYAHFLFEAIGTAARIASSLGYQAAVESTLIPTLTPIVAKGDHDFNPYALQMLGLLLDTASTASPLFVELLDHLLTAEQWTSSTARVPAILRVLAAFFRKQAIFSKSLESHMEGLMQRFQYCLHHKRLSNSAFDLLNDALHYLPINNFKPFLSKLVMTILQKLQSGQTTKLSQQVVAAFSVINCRTQGPPDLPHILNAIQPGLLHNFVINIYVPSAKTLSVIYEKKIALLGLAKMCTATEVQNDQNTLVALIGGCANLMGAVNEEEPSRTRDADIASAEDMPELSKSEEFQGTFNVLVSTRVAVASKELSEVSESALRQNVLNCFDNPILAEKLANQPAWLQMVATLRSP